MVMEPGGSVAGGIGGSVARTIGAGVYVGFGTSAYAHRFSCVAVGVGPNIWAKDALAGEIVKKKRISPTLMNKRISNKLGKSRMRPFEKRAFMESC
jgi:hypothetical protein